MKDVSKATRRQQKETVDYVAQESKTGRRMHKENKDHEEVIQDPISMYYNSPRISNSFLSSMDNPKLAYMRKTRPELFQDEESAALR